MTYCASIFYSADLWFWQTGVRLIKFSMSASNQCLVMIMSKKFLLCEKQKMLIWWSSHWKNAVCGNILHLFGLCTTFPDGLRIAEGEVKNDGTMMESLWLKWAKLAFPGAICGVELCILGDSQRMERISCKHRTNDKVEEIRLWNEVKWNLGNWTWENANLHLSRKWNHKKAAPKFYYPRQCLI